MARRRSSLLDDLVTFPWWVSVALAAVVFLIMRYLLPSYDTGNPILNEVLQVMGNDGGSGGALSADGVALWGRLGLILSIHCDCGDVHAYNAVWNNRNKWHIHSLELTVYRST